MERYRGNTRSRVAVTLKWSNNSAAVLAPSRTAPICSGESPALGTISGSSEGNVTWTNMHDHESLEIRAQLCSCWTPPVPTPQFLTLTNGSGILSVTSFSHACEVYPAVPVTAKINRYNRHDTGRFFSYLLSIIPESNGIW